MERSENENEEYKGSDKEELFAMLESSFTNGDGLTAEDLEKEPCVGEYLPGQKWAAPGDRIDKRGRRRGRGVPDGNALVLQDNDGKKMDKEQIWNILFQLHKNPDPLARFEFPSNLKNDERKYIHTATRKLNLKSKSRGKGINRFLTVWKSDTPQDTTVVPLKLTEEAFQSFNRYLNPRTPLVQKCTRFLTQNSKASSRKPQRQFTGKGGAWGDSKAGGGLAGLAEHLREREKSESFQQLLKFRKTLPSFKKRQQIVDLVSKNRFCLISGSTGCGKSTQVPQFILEHAISERSKDIKTNEKGGGGGGGSTPAAPMVICTQPRRISAMALAGRVADEFGSRVGGKVGYQIRLENVCSPETRIVFCTVGILLRRLLSDPEMRSVSHIIVDEVHERDRLTDFLLIILKDVLSRNRQLKVVLMSATLNADKFADYFSPPGGPKCQCLNVPGFTHKVDIMHLEEIFKLTGYRPKPNDRTVRDKHYLKLWLDFYHGKNMPMQDIISLAQIDGASVADELRPDYDLLERLVSHIVTKRECGAILIFLPGWNEILKAVDRISLSAVVSRNPERFKILPLHSAVSPGQQRQIFVHPKKGVWKIVISTNIAETSITIDDVLYVIDSGHVKEKAYDAHTGMSSLTTRWIAKANSTQRTGRAGRVRRGTCFRLYSSARFASLSAYQSPEMLRSPLEEICLQVKQLNLDRRLAPAGQTGGGVRAFLSLAIDPPTPTMINTALALLRTIGAMTGGEDLTPLGRLLADIPADPRIGKMLVYGAAFRCLSPVLTIAAAVSHRSPFTMCMPFERERAEKAKADLAKGSQSDGIAMLKAYTGWLNSNRGAFCRRNFLSPSALGMIRSIRGQLFRFLKDSGVVSKGLGGPEDPQLNANSADIALVRAMITVGAYPNVALARKGEGKGKDKGKVSIETRDHMTRIKVHPSSVNRRAVDLPHPYLSFFEVMRSTDVYLHNTSVATPLGLVLLTGNLTRFDEGKKEKRKGKGKTGGEMGVEVDRFLRWSCTKGLAERLMGARTVIDAMISQALPRRGKNRSVPVPLGEGEVRAAQTFVRTLLQLETATADQKQPLVRYAKEGGRRGQGGDWGDWVEEEGEEEETVSTEQHYQRIRNLQRLANEADRKAAARGPGQQAPGGQQAQGGSPATDDWETVMARLLGEGGGADDVVDMGFDEDGAAVLTSVEAGVGTLTLDQARHSDPKRSYHSHQQQSEPPTHQGFQTTSPTQPQQRRNRTNPSSRQRGRRGGRGRGRGGQGRGRGIRGSGARGQAQHDQKADTRQNGGGVERGRGRGRKGKRGRRRRGRGRK